MHAPFGQDESVGQYFRNIENNGHTRNQYRAIAESRTTAHQNIFTLLEPNADRLTWSTSGGGATSSSPQGKVDEVENLNESDNYKIWQRYLEVFSCFLSICCLVGIFVVWGVKKSINIELTRNVQFAYNNVSVTDKMRLWHTTVGESCAAGSFDLLLKEPPWENAEKQKYGGFSMEGVIHASHVNLNAIAFFIYLFSASFQGSRFQLFETKCQPAGPEVSRWLEYAFTSPLQVLLVALSFGVSNIDILLGYFGMQLALVIMGYGIEQQIKKTYLRKPETSREKFYSILEPTVKDIRGPMYLLVSWILHLLIWGIPGWWHAGITRWGIAGQYAYIHKYQNKCGDPNFAMQAFVDVIFWGQFVCFSLFGLVCTAQFLRARYLGTNDDTKKDIKACEEYKSNWALYSLLYAVLSVTAKTVLEVGFLGLVATSPEFLMLEPLPKTAFTSYENVTKLSLLDSNRSIAVPPSTCFTMRPETK
jgi:hypothetical protein